MSETDQADYIKSAADANMERGQVLFQSFSNPKISCTHNRNYILQGTLKLKHIKLFYPAKMCIFSRNGPLCRYFAWYWTVTFCELVFDGIWIWSSLGWCLRIYPCKTFRLIFAAFVVWSLSLGNTTSSKVVVWWKPVVTDCGHCSCSHLSSVVSSVCLCFCWF